MATVITLTQLSHRRIMVERRDDGVLVGSESLTFTRSKHYRDAAARIGYPQAAVTEWIDLFKRGQTADGGQTYTPPPVDAFVTIEPATVPRVQSYVVRGTSQPREYGRTFDTFAQALEYKQCPEPEPLIEWTDPALTCAVDIDLIDRREDQEIAALTALIDRVKPIPAVSWITRSLRGVRLIYHALGDWTAAELAGVAALVVASIEPGARIELLDHSRHPRYRQLSGRAGGMEIRTHTPSAEVEAIQRWLGTTSAPGDAQEWLTSKGMELGQRYPHEQCPVCPSNRGGRGGRGPVIAREEGVYCHICAADGVRRGSRAPGWFPFTALCGNPVPTALRYCISRLTHWEHARCCWQTGLSERVARASYEAALRYVHGDDGRIETAFTAGSNLIRADRWWYSVRGEPFSDKIAATLSSLPAARVVDMEEIRAVPERVERLMQTHDLTECGYQDISLVRGLKLWGEFLPYSDSRPTLVVPSEYLSGPDHEHYRPRYLPTARREVMLEQSWRAVERCLPGVNRELITLLIAAKGVAENGAGMPAFVFLEGPTASGKSASVSVAAAICGDVNSETDWVSNRDRVRSAIRTAKDRGSYCTFNEIFKAAHREKAGMDVAMNELLTITPNALAHVLYVGQVPLGRLPVCVWTDTFLPPEIRHTRQFARRLVHVRLPRPVDWERPLAAVGIEKIERLRALSLGEYQLSHCCDVILSDIIDTYFRQPRTFAEIARMLGFGTLDDANKDDADECLLEWFRAVCEAPEPVLTGADAMRWKGRGWKMFQLGASTQIAQCWAALANSDGTDSARITEADWNRLLCTKAPVVCEVQRHGHKFAARFIARTNRKDYQVNGEIGSKGVAVPAGPAASLLTDDFSAWTGGK